MLLDLIIAIFFQIGISFTQIGQDQIVISSDKEPQIQKSEQLPISIDNHIVIVDSDIVR